MAKSDEFTNNCLVCGDPQTGKTTLLSKFISDISWSSPTNDESKSDMIRTCQWEASNKYYSANVNFKVINHIDAIPQLSNENTQALLLFINLNQPKVCTHHHIPFYSTQLNSI